MALPLVPVAALLLTVLVVLPLSAYLLRISVNKPPPSPPPQAAGDGGRRPLPPSPRGLPVLGHLHLLGSLPHRSLRSLARAHGAVMLLRLGRVPTVVVSSAAGAEEVMRARDLAFASRPRSAMADRLLYGSRDVAFAPYGEYWRQARRVCAVHLLSARRVASFRRVREQEAAALVDRVRAAGGAPFELAELLAEYANAVVTRAAVGDECARGLFDGGDRGREQRKVFTDFQTLIGTEPVGELLPWLGWVDAARGLEAKVRLTFQALDGMLDKVIDGHRRPRNGGHADDGDGDHRRDFVDVLLDVQEHDKEIGVQLGTNEMKAIILDMFAAGTDTTSTAMEWAMAELVTHPRAMRKLQDEIRAAAAGVDEGRVSQLRYLKAVVKETLRLHVPVPLLVPREPAADAEILGYRVPAGTRVVINAWAIARDPAAWEDAEEFVPERFVPDGTAAAADYRGQDFRFVPFGAGRRGCPGLGLAEASIEMALAALLYHFDWEAAAGAGPSSLDMTEMSGLAVHIKSGLPLVAEPWIP
ncbi:unnamed protein product [Urochloa decumbens]|uniref:Cytochrome P450 71A1 n=1 Tax=Urochloa decumbens TaxID=240449 RepID=A0ABC9AK02_9POAL